MFLAHDCASIDETKFDFYAIELNHLNFINIHSNLNKKVVKLDKFEEMVELAYNFQKVCLREELIYII